MPTLTINIAASGTPLLESYLRNGGGSSLTGHMWYSITAANGDTFSYGFAHDPDHESWPLAPGFVYPDDSQHYEDKYYTRTIEISQDQYDELMAFGEHPTVY